MQHMEQANSEIRVLTDVELEEVSGASIWSWLKSLFDGPGDLRRPTDQP
jgi:hypothetical protein